MKKRLLFLLSALLVLATVTAQCPTNQEIMQDKLQAQNAFFSARLSERMVGLKAIIATAGNTTEGEILVGFEQDLEQQQTKAQGAVEQNDRKMLQDAIDQTQVTIVKTRKQIKNANKEMLWRNAATDAVQRQHAYLTDLVKEAVHDEDTYFPAAYDALVCQYGIVVGALDDNQSNKQEFENQIDDLRLKRKNFLGALQDAREKCAGSPLNSCRDKAAKDFLGYAKKVGATLQNIKDDIQNKGMREEWDNKIAETELKFNETLEELNKTVNSTSFTDLKGSADRIAERLLSAKKQANDKLFNRTGELLKEIQAQLPSLQDKIAQAIQDLPNEQVTVPEINTTENTTTNETNSTNSSG